MPEIRWVTLLEAPPPEIEILRDLLADEGIETFVPDAVTKLVDPFITGPNPFQERLQVSAADLERAQAVVASSRAAPGAPVASDVEADPDGGDDEREALGEALEAAPDPVEDGARRTILSAALVVTLPLALLFGILYLGACRQHGRRARAHTWALVAMAVPLLLGAAIALRLAFPPPRSMPRDFFVPPPTPIGPR